MWGLVDIFGLRDVGWWTKVGPLDKKVSSFDRVIGLDPAAFLEVVHVEGLALDFLAVFLGHGGGAGVLVQDDDDAAVVLDVVDDGGVVGEEADLGAEDGGSGLADSLFRAEDGVPELEEVAGADVLGAFDVFAPDVVDVGSVRGEPTGAGGFEGGDDQGGALAVADLLAEFGAGEGRGSRR